MREKCRRCGKVLFEKWLLDEKGNVAMDPKNPLHLERDDVDSFYRCPHCSAKNIVHAYEGPDGAGEKLRIIGTKE